MIKIVTKEANVLECDGLFWDHNDSWTANINEAVTIDESIPLHCLKSRWKIYGKNSSINPKDLKLRPLKITTSYDLY